jgi:hypothetical protein
LPAPELAGVVLHLSGWDRDNIAAWAGIFFVAFLGTALLWNKITKGKYLPGLIKDKPPSLDADDCCCQASVSATELTASKPTSGPSDAPDASHPSGCVACVCVGCLKRSMRLPNELTDWLLIIPTVQNGWTRAILVGVRE